MAERCDFIKVGAGHSLCHAVPLLSNPGTPSSMLLTESFWRGTLRPPLNGSASIPLASRRPGH
jgi:hypothetical protein